MNPQPTLIEEASVKELDLDALERVASVAALELPGAWEIEVDDESKPPADVGYRDEDGRLNLFAHCSGGCMEWFAASDHIETFDPPTTLKMISNLRAQAAEIAGRDALIATADRMAEAATKALDALTARVEALEAALTTIKDDPNAGHLWLRDRYNEPVKLNDTAQTFRSFARAALNPLPNPVECGS